MDPQQQQASSSASSDDSGLAQPSPTTTTPFSAQWRRASSSKRRAAGADANKQTKRQHADPLDGVTDSAAAGSGGGGKQPKLTDEEKVEKHRMIVRRSYYQKKELKARLKEDIARLEKQYNELMARTQPSLSIATSSNTAEVAAANSIELFMCTCCESVPCVRALYRELSLKKEELRKQNDALEEQILEHLNFHDKVSFIAARQLDDGAPIAAAGKKSSLAPQSKQSKAAAASAGFITVETSDCWLSFRPLTEEECFTTIRDVQRDVSSQRASASFKEVGPPVMGWNRKRTYGSEAKFSLLKRFEGESAVRLSDRAWSVYTESDLFAQLYSGAVNMRFQLLQRVNSNNVLFYRSLKTDLLKMRRTTFFQLSRVQIDHQIFLIFCSLEPTRIQPDLTNRYNWLDMFSWLCFSDCEDDQGNKYCEVEFGGNVPSASVADNEFWMMEFLSYLLRFENKFVRPVFNVTLG